MLLQKNLQVCLLFFIGPLSSQQDCTNAGTAAVTVSSNNGTTRLFGVNGVKNPEGLDGVSGTTLVRNFASAVALACHIYLYNKANVKDSVWTA